MAENPSTLTGTQKAAVVLMSMDADKAAEVMKQFSESEAESITAEIIRMRRVDPDVAEQTLGEFQDLARSGRVSSHGGREFATGLLERSFGMERAAGLMSRVASSMAGKAFEFLDDAEPTQVITLLDGEMPQTIALVLAHLRPGHASQVMMALSNELRAEVARRIAELGSATPEAVAVVAQSLKARSAVVVAPRNSVQVVGGVQPLVDIINRSDAATERLVLAGLDELDPELAEEVRSRMLTFADIVRLEPRDVQVILRGIDTAILATAMKGTSETVASTVRENLSERNRELLEDDLRSMGPVRKSQVEEAQAEVIRAIRELEAGGGIVVHRNEEDALVD